MRFLHLIVVAALVSAAAYAYKVKFDSALQAERVEKLTADLARERDAIASLRAEWSQLDNPTRIQGLAARHLKLKPIDATQFDDLLHLPDRPTAPAANIDDPIGAIIDQTEAPTGRISASGGAR